MYFISRASSSFKVTTSARAVSFLRVSPFVFRRNLSPSAINASLMPSLFAILCNVVAGLTEHTACRDVSKLARASRTVVILRYWRTESAQNDDHPSARFARTREPIFSILDALLLSRFFLSLSLFLCRFYPTCTRVLLDATRSEAISRRAAHEHARARSINVEVHLYGEENEQRHAVLGMSVCASLIFHTLENGRIMGSGGVREFDSLSRYPNAQLALSATSVKKSIFLTIKRGTV